MLKPAFLHLAPGLLLLAGFSVLAPFLWRAEIPVGLAVVSVVLAVVIPFEWGFLFWQGKRQTGR